jgi:hypothetical protein
MFFLESAGLKYVGSLYVLAYYSVHVDEASMYPGYHDGASELPCTCSLLKQGLRSRFKQQNQDWILGLLLRVNTQVGLAFLAALGEGTGALKN